MWQKAVFIIALIFCLSPYGSPPAALALGLLLAFLAGNPFPSLSGKFSRYLLQGAVVMLGFGMNLEAIYQAGRDGILFTIGTIFGTLILGYFVGKLLSVKAKTSALISSGTAICGGSAIAAVGPAIHAEPDEMSVSLGTVFILNSIALFVFPIIGKAVDLTQTQFGIWSAIAIHDTSSVVGAAQAFGQEAVAVATTVKLARALWIAPVALIFAFIYRNTAGEGKARVAMPWFILLFVGAAAIRTFAPPEILPSIFESLVNLGKAGLTLTLFIIGVSLTPQTIRSVGPRPLVQGILLWAAISIVSFFAVRSLV